MTWQSLANGEIWARKHRCKRYYIMTWSNRITSRVGLVVWFLLWVEEVPGSIPGLDRWSVTIYRKYLFLHHKLPGNLIHFAFHTWDNISFTFLLPPYPYSNLSSNHSTLTCISNWPILKMHSLSFIQMQSYWIW